MTIVSQNGSCIVNYDNVVAISVQGRYIHAYSTSGENIPIGVYADEDRAKEVLVSIVEFLDEMDSVDVIHNVGLAAIAKTILVMPEE